MKKTYIIIIIMVLIPVIAAASILAILRKDAPAGEESAEESIEESAAENDCAHENTRRAVRRSEDDRIPEGAAGVVTQICNDCGAETDVRPLWEYEFGENMTLLYFENDDAGCTVLEMDTPRNTDRLELPEEANGLPVTALDTDGVLGWHASGLYLPDTVNYLSQRFLQLCSCDIVTGEGNPYYKYSNRCLVDLRTGELVHSLAGCVIPDDGSVTKIGETALRCENYTVRIPASITEITGKSFLGGGGDLVIEVDGANETFAMIENCLVNVKTKTLVFGCPGWTIPRDGSVTRIGVNAFAYGTYRPEETFIPACIEYIGPSAFYWDPKKVIIEDLAAWLRIDFADSGSTPFRPYGKAQLYDADGNRLTHITIPDGITEIKNYAFYECRDLESVTFNGTETRIGDMAFCNSSLAELDLPGSVRELGQNAFYNCKITGVTLPASVIKIGMGCFASCPLQNLEMENGGNGVYSVRENCIIDVAEKKLIFGCGDHIPADGSVERICERAFESNRNITRLDVPDSVKYIDRQAFAHCLWLVSASFPAGLEYLGDEAFIGCNMLTDVIFDRESGAEIGCFAFQNCPLMTVELPGKVERIRDSAFFSWAPEKLILPDSLKSIAISAIQLNGLTELYIGRSLETLPNILSTSLQVIEVHPENKKYAAVSGCLIDKTAAKLIAVCDGAVIPSDGSVKELGRRAFAQRGITEIRVPAAVETVGGMAFLSCADLKTVILEEGVKTIGARAFELCVSLEEITLPRSVESVDGQAFAKCASLKTVYAYSGTVFAEDAFAGMEQPPEIIIIDNG